MKDGQKARRIQGQILKFAGELSVGLPKVARRAVAEILYGIQSRGSVMLSEIARSLDEATRMKKIIERLGRQLSRTELRHKVRERQLELAACALRDREDPLLVLDLTDVAKPYAREMEYLAQVRDGSEDELVPGYSCVTVVATEVGSADVVPVYQELYSHVAPHYESENDEILGAIRTITAAVGEGGTWVIDRGADRGKIIGPLLEDGRSFLIRMRGDRHLTWRRKPRSTEEIARRCVLPHRAWVKKRNRRAEQKWKTHPLRFGATPVHWHGHELTLVVVEGLGEKPLMLLTNTQVRRSRKQVWRVVRRYLSRWRVEEVIRFVKESYGFEDVRLLCYERLRSMAVLVMAAAYFLCVRLGQGPRLRTLAREVIGASRRIYERGNFRFYGLAAGLRQLLYGRRLRPFRASAPLSVRAPLGP